MIFHEREELKEGSLELKYVFCIWLRRHRVRQDLSNGRRKRPHESGLLTFVGGQRRCWLSECFSEWRRIPGRLCFWLLAPSSL